MTVEPVFQTPAAHRRIDAMVEPLTVYEHLYSDASYAFFYESLENDQMRGRYSFLGGRPRLVFQSKRDRISLHNSDKSKELHGHPLEILRRLLGRAVDAPAVTPFSGGAVGYLGYDMVRFFENVPDDNPDDPDLPDSCFIFPQEVVAFDHLTGTVHLFVHSSGDGSQDLDRLEASVHACAGRPRIDLAAPPSRTHDDGTPPMISRTTQLEFIEAVNRAQEHIRAGDIFQVVLSRRFDFAVCTSPVALYKALRRANPSPYMYLLNLDDMSVLGSSPEILVKLERGRVITRPLAGTRPRGETPEQDRLYERELLADEKERAEHIMLVDLSRNDLSRVCSYGTVRTTELLEVERYSHVMHLVSHVEGRLTPDRDAFDVLGATFPAGTVSGAPKVRAMEIIEELESLRRGVYAGAIGYFSLLGDMDMCIAIRTIVLKGERGFIQAGAGIVADSVPQREFEETAAKARGMMRAVSSARGAA